MKKNNEIKITIPIKPLPQQRPYFSNKHGFPQAIERPKSRNYKKAVADYCAWDMVSNNINRIEKGIPVSVDISFFLEVPKSFNKKKKAQALCDIIRPMNQSDLDNYVKAVLDAVNKILFYDDSQIVELKARLLYASSAHTELKVKKWSRETSNL